MAAWGQVRPWRLASGCIGYTPDSGLDHDIVSNAMPTFRFTPDSYRSLDQPGIPAPSQYRKMTYQLIAVLDFNLEDEERCEQWSTRDRNPNFEAPGNQLLPAGQSGSRNSPPALRRSLTFLSRWPRSGQVNGCSISLAARAAETGLRRTQQLLCSVKTPVCPLAGRPNRSRSLDQPGRRPTFGVPLKRCANDLAPTDYTTGGNY